MSQSTVDEFLASDRFRLREDLVVEEVDDEFMILDLSHNTYFGLNGVGRLIWQGLGEQKRFDEIVEEVCESYEVPREQAAADAEAFIREILERKLAHRL